MKVTELEPSGLLLLEPETFEDDRGFLLESFNRRRHAEAGILAEFVQDNHSRSRYGVIRGLHYQRLQGKLVSVVRGEVFDVAVDIRPDSPTFGQWAGALLSDSNHHQLFLPPGFAHGFGVLSDVADVVYKATDFYAPEQEGGIIWDDPDIGVAWPIEAPILSARDRQSPRLRDVPREGLITCAELRALGWPLK